MSHTNPPQPQSPPTALSLAPDPLADRAAAMIADGSVVGLGTGRAAARVVHAIARRVARERLSLRFVSTSRATDDLAARLGLRVESLADAPRIGALFDGADEADPRLNMIKGGGAAMTLERIVARATLDSGGTTVYLVDPSKLSASLGATRPLPVETLPPALAAVTRWLAARGMPASQRRNQDGSPTITDFGNPILDARVPSTLASQAELAALALALDTCPGVVDHGLFLTECQHMLVEHPDGAIQHLTR